MIARHTPGPWRTLRKNPRRVVGSENRHIIIAGCYTSLSKGRGLATKQSGGSPDQRIAEANARLIAAAPDLLDVVQRCEMWLSTAPDGRAMQMVCQAVIEKALGGKEVA